MHSSQTRIDGLSVAFFLCTAIRIAIFAPLTFASQTESTSSNTPSIRVRAHASAPIVRAGDAFTFSCAVRLVGFAPAQSTSAVGGRAWPLRTDGVAPEAFPFAERTGRSRRSIRRRRCVFIPSLCDGSQTNLNFSRDANNFFKSVVELTPPPELLRPKSVAMNQPTRPSALSRRGSGSGPKRVAVAPQLPSYVNVSVMNGRAELVRARVRARREWTHDSRLTMDVVYPPEERRMRVLPAFGDIDRARIDEFEVRPTAITAHQYSTALTFVRIIIIIIWNIKLLRAARVSSERRARHRQCSLLLPRHGRPAFKHERTVRQSAFTR